MSTTIVGIFTAGAAIFAQGFDGLWHETRIIEILDWRIGSEVGYRIVSAKGKRDVRAESEIRTIGDTPTKGRGGSWL